MSMQPIESAIALKQTLDELRPLSTEDEQRIMQKFRLDWNYHSNHLEGNSLTYGETKALILFGVTAGGKPIRDALEMTGHNEALRWIEEIIREERPLTENFIRQLHQLILKEDYQVDAETPDGKPTKKWVRVGKYKTEPNHVKTVTDEMFYFATPEETPAKMHDLMQWYREQSGKIQPILLAAEFHYRFIRIHPFDDGNGRTARILMNFILMKFGYPPAIIKTEDKQNYFAVLRQADVGVLAPFVEYIATNVVRSLEIMIRGAKGEDIEESDDLDKELALLEQRFKSTEEKIEKNVKSKKAIVEFCKASVLPLFKRFFMVCIKFNRFYLESHFTLAWSELENKGRSIKSMSEEGKEEAELVRYMNHMQERVTESTIEMLLSHQYYSAINLDSFNYEMRLEVRFSYDRVEINTNNSEFNANKSYNQRLTEKEINTLVKSEAKHHKEILEQKLEEIDKKDNSSL